MNNDEMMDCYQFGTVPAPDDDMQREGARRREAMRERIAVGELDERVRREAAVRPQPFHPGRWINGDGYSYPSAEAARAAEIKAQGK